MSLDLLISLLCLAILYFCCFRQDVLQKHSVRTSITTATRAVSNAPDSFRQTSPVIFLTTFFGVVVVFFFSRQFVQHTGMCNKPVESTCVMLPAEWVARTACLVCPARLVRTHIKASCQKNFWWSWNSDIFQSYNQSQYDREITTFPQEQSVSSGANQLIWRSHK